MVLQTLEQTRFVGNYQDSKLGEKCNEMVTKLKHTIMIVMNMNLFLFVIVRLQLADLVTSGIPEVYNSLILLASIEVVKGKHSDCSEQF